MSGVVGEDDVLGMSGPSLWWGPIIPRAGAVQQRSVAVVVADGLEHEAEGVEPEGHEVGRRVLRPFLGAWRTVPPPRHVGVDVVHGARVGTMKARCCRPVASRV